MFLNRAPNSEEGNLIEKSFSRRWFPGSTVFWNV